MPGPPLLSYFPIAFLILSQPCIQFLRSEERIDIFQSSSSSSFVEKLKKPIVTGLYIFLKMSEAARNSNATSDEVIRWQADKTIGIIGLGDMGKLYARILTVSGWKVNACDREEKYEGLKEEFKDMKGLTIFRTGHEVSRSSDYIIYAVETENIDGIVKKYGPSTKMGAIVGGQTSCKAPEIKAFETHLPSDVEIISCHSLHGPSVNPKGQPLVLIRHRASDESFRFVESALSCMNSRMVYLTAEEHDKITADTQAVTHAAFIIMGTAWKANNQYPWTISKWMGGIENAKVNISLRIYSNKWHVYAGLAITNPAAHRQVLQYASSVTEIFKLMIESRQSELRERLHKARDAIFGSLDPSHSLLLTDEVLGKFALNRTPSEGETPPNSHLSILAIVDSWYQLGINPYDHMICSTPLFRIWLGVTEHIFSTPGLLDECIDFSVGDNQFRRDDLEFVIAARNWSDIIRIGDFNHYRHEFESIKEYFAPMFPEATAIGNEMISTILKKTE